MKANYVYKQKLYTVTLMGDKSGQNSHGLELLFAEDSRYYHMTIADNWQDKLGKPVQIAEWLKISEWAYICLLTELETIGATAEVSDSEKFVLFDDRSLLEDFPRRYAASHNYLRRQSSPNRTAKWENNMVQFKNEWYSRPLLKVDEPALELWAKAEGIEEAYRLTTLPAFSSSEVIRMYRKDGVFHIVCNLVNQTSQTAIEKGKWESLKAFMDEHFWTADTWYSKYGFGVLDGTKLLFEGWRDGQYKFLDDHSPEQDKIAHKAHKLFEAIHTESKKG